MSVVGIVLAGGGSTRFGADKLAAELDGRPLLHHALERVGAVAERIVLVVAPDAAAPPLPLGLEHRIEVVRDDARHQGPLAAVASALAGLDAGTTALVVGGDMPWLVPGVLRLLAEHLARNDAPAAAVLEGDPLPTLPVALRASVAAPAARALLAADRRSLRALFDEIGFETIPAATWRALDPAGATLADVDTPADLAPDTKTPVPGRKDGRLA
jgi:molybdopterin-guanine dinucleotide biosynthesis protein A